MRYFIAVALLAAFFNSLALAAEAPFRTWTDAAGSRQVRARLLAADGDRATFEKEGGQTVSMPIARLSQGDQNYIRTGAAALKGTALKDAALEAAASAPAAPAPLAGLLAALVPAAEAAPTEVVYVRLSRAFLNRDISQRLVVHSPVDQEVLDATVDGTATTETTPTLVMVPDEQQAVLELRLAGVVRSQTTAHSGPMEVYNQGTTEFTASKTIRLVGTSVKLDPAWTRATSHLTTTGMDTNLGLGRRLALRIAERQVERTRAKAEAVTAELTAERIDRALDEAAEKGLRTWVEPAQSRLARLAADNKLGLRRVHCSTTSEFLQIALCGPGQCQAAAGPDWTADHHPDIEIAVHASLVVKTLTDYGFRQRLESLRDKVRDTAEGVGLTPVSLGLESSQPRRAYSLHWSDEQRWLMISWNAPAAEGDSQPPAETAGPAVDISAAPLVVGGH